MRPLVSLCEADFSMDTGDLTTDSRMEGVSPDILDTETQQQGQQEQQSGQRSSQQQLQEQPAGGVTKEGVAEGRDEVGISGATQMGPLTPALVWLDIRDNAIDYFGISTEERVKTFEPIICMRAVKR